MKEVEGNLVEMALNGEFDVIAHGCNCQNTMNSGVARAIRDVWESVYVVDCQTRKGDYKKLGTWSECAVNINVGQDKNPEIMRVLNCYTQYMYGREVGKVYVNYDAIAMCMDKINYFYSGKRIGLPLIGCGLAGGDWDIVKGIISSRLKDCDVTIVRLKL